MTAGDHVQVKKKCCDDRDRCKSCPVVWKRLAMAGWCTKVSKREYAVAVSIPKSVHRAARKGATGAELRRLRSAS